MKKLTLLLLLMPFGLFAQLKGVLSSDAPYFFSPESDTYSAGNYKKGDTLQVLGFTYIYAIAEHTDKRKIYIPERYFIKNEGFDQLKKIF